MARDVSSRYSRRGRQEYEKVCGYIRAMAGARAGNYLVFFPSYAFMDGVYEALSAGSREGLRIIRQSSRMTEAERETFLEEFGTQPAAEEGSLVGFCVMGGIFSEGIDLTGERLVGVIVVGTGLPQICTEREILRGFYDEAGKCGFDFAYRFPGMNKVQQAAGRVIRTARDRGVIVLLDDRFLHEESAALFPREWDDCQVTDRRRFAVQVREFWERETDEIETMDAGADR